MQRDRDPRLEFQDPAIEQYRRQQNANIYEFAKTVRSDAWQGAIELYVQVILAAAGLGAAPVGLNLPMDNSELLEEGRKLLASLAGGNARPNLQAPATVALCQGIGTRLAEIGKSFSDWEAIHRVINDFWPLYEAWLVNLSTDDVAACEEQIVKVPHVEHVTDLFEAHYTFDSRFRGSYQEPIDALRALGFGLWDAVNRAWVSNRALRLSENVQFREALARKISTLAWLKWVLSLPLLSMQQIAFQELDNIAMAMEATTILLGAGDISLDVSEEQQIVGIHATLDLLTRIGVQLARRTIPRGLQREDDEALRKQAIADYAYWQEEELHGHLKRMADLIANHGHQSLLKAILSGLYCFDTSKLTTEGLFRKALVDALGQNPEIGPSLIDNLLHNPTNTVLLNTALLLFWCQAESETFVHYAEHVWNAFGHVIQAPEFNGIVNFLTSDNHEFAWTMAAMLANQKDVQGAFSEGLKAIGGEPEGWGWHADTFYLRQGNVLFYLIVGAMAAEWLVKASNIGLARSLYHEVWKYSHYWMRFTPEFQQQNSLLVKELWARLPMVCEDGELEDRALGGLAELDNPEHVVLACDAITKNVVAPSVSGPLPASLQHVLRDVFDAQFPVVRSSGRLNEAEIKWYEARVETLVPTQSPSN